MPERAQAQARSLAVARSQIAEWNNAMMHNALSFATYVMAVSLSCASIVRASTRQETPISESERLTLIGKANESAVEQIRTVQGVYSVKNMHVHADGSGEVTATLFMRWWMDADRHRLKYYVTIDRRDGRGLIKENVHDMFLNTDRSFILAGYDWESSPQVSLRDNSVNGYIDRRKPAFPQANPLADLLLNLQVSPVARTLLRLIREGKDVKLIERTEADPDLIEVQATTPEEGRRWTVQVDPAVNYLVRRARTDPTDAERATGGRTRQVEVTTFLEVEPGIFFPSAVVTRSAKGNDGSYDEFRLEFSSLSVNGPIEADAFDFQFPENTMVHDVIEDVAHVWGNGKPAHTVRTMEEDAELGRRLFGRDVAEPSGSSPPLLASRNVLGLPPYGLGLILTLLLTGPLAWYVRRKVRARG